VPLSRVKASGCSANPLDGVLEVKIPEPGCPVEAATGQCVPIRAERHRCDEAGTAGQGMAEGAGVRGFGDVPELDRAVSVAAGQLMTQVHNA